MPSNNNHYTTRKQGRRNKLTPARETALVKMYRENLLPVKDIAAAFGITKPTLYNILKRHAEAA